MTATAARRQHAEAIASQKESQLSEVRKERKQTDDKLQAALNRIAFLKQEESKIDRDIENARKRTLELLSRKAEKAEKLKDGEVLSTTKDILGSIAADTKATGSKPLRPTTGTGRDMQWDGYDIYHVVGGLHHVQHLSMPEDLEISES